MDVESIVKNIRSATRDDLNVLQEAVNAERVRRDVVASAREEARDAAERYAEAVADESATEYETGQVIGPGEKVIENGIEVVNTSKAWLSVGPADYPLGYERTETPEDVAPFQPGESVETGDLREYEGTIYEVLQAHTTAAHWSPDEAHSLWTRA